MGNYLFADPSFLSGAARVLDFGGVFDDYNDSPTAAAADERAMRSDWNVVGRDLVEAMDETSEELDTARE